MKATKRNQVTDDLREAQPVPIEELGGAFILTELLGRAMPSATAIESLLQAARRIGWQPVGDVLRSAVERCLARRHLQIDARQRLVITMAGRHWLVHLLAQNFAAGPACCSDMLMTCQRRTAAQVPPAAGARILKAVEREKRHQAQLQGGILLESTAPR